MRQGLAVKYDPGQPYDFVAPDGSLAYLGIPKVGSATIREAMFNNQRPTPVTREVAMVSDCRIAFVRHPLSRILSAWKYGWHEVAFVEWWSVVRENPRFDLHVYPMAEILRGDYTHIFRLEDLTEVHRYLRSKYPDVFATPLRWQNRAKYPDPEIPHRVKKDIINIYRADLELYMGIQEF